jgi:DNA-binding IclR family transcriptional regulator
LELTESRPRGTSGRRATGAEPLGTVDKAIDVLFHLHGAGGPEGVTAIGRTLSMPKSSVHRLLAALLRRGLVERDDRGRYRPGVGLVALGLGVLEREPVVVAARPILEQCAEEVGETFFLVAARAGALVVLDKAEGTGFLRAAPRVGSTVPVNATAVGKLYLAFSPGDLDAHAVEERARFTDRTLVDAVALARDVEAVSESGVARNCDEWIPGLSVLAAPVWLGERLAAAVALAAPSPRLHELGEQALAQRVRAAAARITRRLSGPSSDPIFAGPPA